MFLDIHVDGGKKVLEILDLGCIVRQRQIFLSDIGKLLPELQLPCYCASGKNPLEIHPRLLCRLAIPNVAQELVTHIGCKVVENSACRLSPSQKISVC